MTPKCTLTRLIGKRSMNKYIPFWLFIFIWLLCLFFFFVVYIWISMSRDLAVYAGYAGTLQALIDYQKGDFNLYKKIDASNETLIEGADKELFTIKEYAIDFFDISGRYGKQNYVNAYNSKMKHLYNQGKHGKQGSDSQ